MVFLSSLLYNNLNGVERLKLRKYYLAIIVTVFFIVCFTIINTKYDEFYRIQGIDNECRILIEQYLNDEDKKILIENSYSTDRFLPYITINGFSMANLEYYELVKAGNIFTSNKEIVQKTNQVLQKSSQTANPTQVENHLKTLIEYNVMEGYIDHDDFDFSYISYYALVKQANPKLSEYVEVVHFFLEQFKKDQLLETTEYAKYLEKIINTYSKESIDEYMSNVELHTTHTLVFEINKLSTISEGQSIVYYEAKNTERVEVSRMTYFTYLDSEANQALQSMYDRIKEVFPNKVLILNYGYIPYADQNDVDFYGAQEFQLGTSIDVFEKGISSNSFEESEISTWLQENAYLYGFILRYPKSNPNYTPTIYRYVGIEVAQVIYERNLTLEDYNKLYNNGGSNE